jgi:hypothetical protein
MDDIVAAALRKWPNVPACFGWLALDARGNWWLRDHHTQMCGEFPQCRGDKIENQRLIDFICRNYESDPNGAWYFQNGPQRVYVDLEVAPLIAGVYYSDSPFTLLLTSHLNRDLPAPTSTWLDESGRLYVGDAKTFALIKSTDLYTAASLIQDGHWPRPHETTFSQLQQTHRFNIRPRI